MGNLQSMAEAPEGGQNVHGAFQGLAALADAAMLNSNYNPITNEVESVTKQAKDNQPKSLEDICGSAVKQAVTIFRFSQICQLPLPGRVVDKLSQLCLENFRINPADLTNKHHRDKTFPAICLFDLSRIELRLINGPPNPDCVSFLTTFACNGINFEVHKEARRLDDMIHRVKTHFTFFTEEEIWFIALKLSQATKSCNSQSTIKPECVFSLPDNTLFLRFPSEPDQDTEIMSGVAFYEAPEVLMQQPQTEQSRMWSIGCILYEIAALEPAYYDREKTGNAMAPMMEITQGTLPPELERYSDDLKNLIKQCLIVNPETRPTLDHTIQFSKDKLKAIEMKSQ
ncbi:unnamed protein product [Owenia fusiformis]|uniref:non-specific serine/threonine protein kinase n=1 Tax=Owenia fusiformis TaxID=6347 RepID=A0A8J1UV77_OWEFU|nr:unnamed protein product [Owenia fusiformis]